MDGSEDRIEADEVVELTRRLVRFDTTNPPGNEEPAIRFLGSYLAGNGVEVEYQELEPDRVNLIARLPGASETGHLVLSGHMDVVPAGNVAWQHRPFDADLVDGRIVGRGAADMKGGVAAMAVALLNLARAGFRPAADVVLVVSSGEETGGAPGARLMASSGILAGSQFLIVGEPTGLALCPAQKGVQAWMIDARGRACHSSTPHLGINAVSYLARVIPILEANPFPFTPHPLLGEPTVSVTQIEGGAAPNIIPEHCRVTVTARLVPGQDGDAQTAQVTRILDAVAEEYAPGIVVDLETRWAPALATPPGHPFLQAVESAVTEVRGEPPSIKPFTGGTEAAILGPAYDMPMVIFGPGHLEQAHEVDEYVEIEDLVTAARVYENVARRILG